ncbi:MAG: glycosyltransferase family 4 protein [Patescibacteria group bacterium]|nr:glycosyltransferase family 4 protein [Patescibacteria group bacterium]
MKILYIITQADNGGAQKYVLTLAKHFGGAIAAGNEKNELLTKAKTAGLKVFELKHLKRKVNLWHDLLAIWEITRLIKTFNPDLVHLNSTKAGLLGSLAGRLAGVKVVFTAHGFRYLEPLSPAGKRFYLLMEKLASRFRDRVIAVSQTDYNAAIVDRIIVSQKILVIHNGITQTEFYDQAAARAKLGLANDKIQIGAVAGLYLTKGLDVLIDAVAKLQSLWREKIFVTIIGDGPEYQNCQIKIADLGLAGQIKLTGNVDEAARCLKAFNVFVIPSRKEGLPFALLEAMQASLPIIAARVGGVPEALKDGGLLVPPENPKALAQALEQIMTDGNLATRLAMRARELSREFTQEKMLAETEKLYEAVLKK